MGDNTACCRTVSFDDKGKPVTSLAASPGEGTGPNSILLRLTSHGQFTIHLQPKPLEDDEIRLFVLFPGPDDASIAGYLFHTPFSRSPPYQAVSWVWGSNTTDTAQIRVNDCMVSVRANLLPALRAFRKEDEPLILWIDTLCINQADTAERNRQVRLMERIYVQSESVLAWLGLATAQSYLGITVFLSNLLQSDEFDTADLPPVNVDLVPPPGAPYDELVSKFQTYMEGSTDITSREWWHRIWIVQEVLLSRKAYLCIGKARFLWPQCPPTSTESPVPAAAKSGVWSLRCLQRRLAPDNARPSVLDVFTMTHPRYCTDPRDRVFAILGLVDPPDAVANCADYELTLAEVQRRLFRTSVELHQDLRILTHARGLCSSSSNASDLTWLPRWGMDQRRQELYALHPVETLSITEFAHLWNHPMMIAAVEDEFITAKVAYYASRTHKASGSSAPKLHMGLAPALEGFSFDVVQNVRSQATLDDNEWVAWSNGVPTEEWLSTTLGVSSDTSNGKAAARHLARITTADGRGGNTTRFCRDGDVVCILFGGNVPCILRKTTDDPSDRYMFVCEAYIEGVMNGEMMEELVKGLYEVQMFEFV